MTYAATDFNINLAGAVESFFMLIDLSNIKDKTSTHVVLTELMPALIEQQGQSFRAVSVEAVSETGVVFGLPDGSLTDFIPFESIIRITPEPA